MCFCNRRVFKFKIVSADSIHTIELLNNRDARAHDERCLCGFDREKEQPVVYLQHYNRRG